nr:MAG TPA: hypothetical protein [Caudoviricetes sp.]
MELSIYRITRILDGTDHYYKGVKAIRVYHEKVAFVFSKEKIISCEFKNIPMEFLDGTTKVEVDAMYYEREEEMTLVEKILNEDNEEYNNE